MHATLADHAHPASVYVSLDVCFVLLGGLLSQSNEKLAIYQISEEKNRNEQQ